MLNHVRNITVSIKKPVRLYGCKMYIARNNGNMSQNQDNVAVLLHYLKFYVTTPVHPLE